MIPKDFDICQAAHFKKGHIGELVSDRFACPFSGAKLQKGDIVFCFGRSDEGDFTPCLSRCGLVFMWYTHLRVLS